MGSGVYVNASRKPGRERHRYRNEHGLFKILQARCIIESAIAKEAVWFAKPKCIAKLDDIIERMAGMLENSALNCFANLIYDQRSLSSYFENSPAI